MVLNEMCVDQLMEGMKWGQVGVFSCPNQPGSLPTTFPLSTLGLQVMHFCVHFFVFEQLIAGCKGFIFS